MYHQKIVRKMTRLPKQAPASLQMSQSQAKAPLPSVLQRAKQDPNTLSADERQQLENIVGTRSTQALLSGDHSLKSSGFTGITNQLQHDFGQLSPSIQMKQATHIDTSRTQPENKAGLPENLKLAVETLSGFAMDDVRVHYNSPRPAELQALAYTQGTDIHIAPGQEQHLPHEAWHVVQQKQGRVKPDSKVKGIAVNNDRYLEQEADKVGEQISKTKLDFGFLDIGQRMDLGSEIKYSSKSYTQIVQRVLDPGIYIVKKKANLRSGKVEGYQKVIEIPVGAEVKVEFPSKGEQFKIYFFTKEHTWVKYETSDNVIFEGFVPDDVLHYTWSEEDWKYGGFEPRAAEEVSKITRDMPSRIIDYAEVSRHTLEDLSFQKKDSTLQEDLAIVEYSHLLADDSEQETIKSNWINIATHTAGPFKSGKEHRKDQSGLGPYATANGVCADPLIQDSVRNWVIEEREKAAESEEVLLESKLHVLFYDDKEPCHSCGHNLGEQSHIENLNISLFLAKSSDEEKGIYSGAQFVREVKPTQHGYLLAWQGNDNSSQLKHITTQLGARKRKLNKVENILKRQDELLKKHEDGTYPKKPGTEKHISNIKIKINKLKQEISALKNEIAKLMKCENEVKNWPAIKKQEQQKAAKHEKKRSEKYEFERLF